MPSNKKKSSSKKKGAKKKSAPSQEESAAQEFDLIKQRVQRIEERCSNEIAAQLEESFQQEYPPSMDYEMEYVPSKSKKQITKEENAYSKVSKHFNEGLKLTETPTNIPGISRWHLVTEKMMDALDVVLNSATEPFLTTTGTDRRNLLSKVCLTIAQCRGKALDCTGHVAWAKVAVAADPTYSNTHNQLGLGYMNGRNYPKALEASEQAYRLGIPSQSSLPERLDCLRRIVHSQDRNSERELVLESRGQAVRWWQEMSMMRPTRTCAFCFGPGENKCSKCKTVYYCSRQCQRFDYKEHKQVCVAPSNVPQQEYPKPNFAQDELCSEDEWRFFQQVKRTLREPSTIIAASNNCHLGAVKRALMEGDDVNTLGSSVREYPVQMAALRREPENAVEIMKVLIQHGACPNVIRGDGKHLLSICRERAKWIDDTEPSMDNTFFRMQHGLLGDDTALQGVEREESQELVELVSNAIQQHKLCRLCKARKQNEAAKDAHLHVENLTDQLLARQNRLGG